MADPKNVLFIAIDQFRADLLFGNLGKNVQLPNLRALADDAVDFRNHHSVVNPCGPSRVSLLTGQYAMNHQSVHNGTPLRHDTPNLATEVRKTGYWPMLFGYTDTTQDPRIHHANDPALATYEHPMVGFEEVVEMRLEESYPWRADLITKGYDLPDYSEFYFPIAADGDELKIDDPAFYSAEDSDTAFLTNSCINALAARKGEQWFAHLTYIRPHPPLVAPTPYNKMYNPSEMPKPTRASSEQLEFDAHPFFAARAGVNTPASVVHGFPDLENTDKNIQTLRAIYAGLATEVDHHIGRVIQFLKESGQYDDTLIVVTADHGEMLGDHHNWGKMSPYDAAYHTPLIIRDPEQSDYHGTIVDNPTESIDIMPTILDWVSQTIPDSVNGAALTPFLREQGPHDWRNSSYSELAYAGSDADDPVLQKLDMQSNEATLAILRTEEYKLVHFNGGLPPLLFNRADKDELINLAEDPKYHSKVLELTQLLLNRRMSYPDTTLSKLMQGD